MNEKIWLGVGIAIAVYILFRILNMNEEIETPIDKEIDKIVNSEEYKVKGQYD